MAIDLSRGYELGKKATPAEKRLEISRGAEISKEFRHGIDLSKLIRAEIIFKELCHCCTARKTALSTLEEKYAISWLACYARHKDDPSNDDMLHQFVSLFSSDAAKAFLDITAQHFAPYMAQLQETPPATPQFYLVHLLPAKSIDLRFYLHMGDKVIAIIDNVVKGEAAQKIEQQFAEQSLKEYFLQQYIQLFKDNGYVLRSYEEMKPATLTEYLFMLASGNMEIHRQQQIPGLEQVIRYIDKEPGSSAVNQTKGVFNDAG